MSARVKILLIILGKLLAVSYISFAFVSFSGRGDDRLCTDLIITIKDSTEVRFVSEQMIRATLHENDINPIGLRMREINLGEIERLLMQYPVIERVESYRTTSGRLRVDIWQKRPIFRVMTNNRNYYIDRNRNRIPLSDDFVAHVPIVTGFNINNEFLFNELFDFIVFLRNNDFWYSQIVQIHVDQYYEITLVPRVGNHLVLLGELTDYERKLSNLKRFYSQAFEGGYWNRYSKVNLRYRGQIVCTKR